jgi:hypothetical protein
MITEIVQIHQSSCQSSIRNCKKALFFCLSCGSQSQSSHTLGRLQERGCKHVRVKNNKSKKSPSKKNPAEESVMRYNDNVGYEVDNTHEPASEQWRDSEFMPQ